MVDRIEQTLTDNRTSVKVKLRRPKTESTEHREKGITRGLNTEELQRMQHEGIQDKTKNQPFHLTRQGNIREAGIRRDTGFRDSSISYIALCYRHAWENSCWHEQNVCHHLQ